MYFKLILKDLPGLGIPPGTPGTSFILDKCGTYSSLNKLEIPINKSIFFNNIQETSTLTTLYESVGNSNCDTLFCSKE